jgi:hypothetical protein
MCTLALYDREASVYGLCGICVHSRSAQDEFFCVLEREEEGEEGRTITVKKERLEPKVVKRCNDFEEDWDSDDDDATEEYHKLINKLFGPHGTVYDR